MSLLDTVNDFYQSWSEGDIDSALNLCTDEIIFNNIPMAPIQGKDSIKDFLGRFGRGMSDIHCDILNVLEGDDIVMVEGVENYVKKGNKVAVPYMAVFLFQDGRISEWKDYFDLATVEKQLGLK